MSEVPLVIRCAAAWVKLELTLHRAYTQQSHTNRSSSRDWAELKHSFERWVIFADKDCCPCELTLKKSIFNDILTPWSLKSQFLCCFWCDSRQEVNVFICVKAAHRLCRCAFGSLYGNMKYMYIYHVEVILTRTFILGSISYAETNSWVMRIRCGFMGWPRPYV